ncbi:MAG TPA: hypothetical protein VF942_18480, partial [Acidimicrobiales bacterium]
MLALVLFGTACSGGGHSNANKTTTTTAPATTTTLDPTKAAILAAYRASWADFIAVADTYPVNPLDPRLPAHDTGKELTGVRQALTKLMVQRHYNRGSTELNPVVTSVLDDAATAMDCIFDHSVEVDGSTNTPVERPNVGHTLLRFTLSRINGNWFVSDSTALKSGRLEDACTPSVG